VFTISFAIAKKKVNPGKIFGKEIRKKNSFLFVTLCLIAEFKLNNRTLISFSSREKKDLVKKHKPNLKSMKFGYCFMIGNLDSSYLRSCHGEKSNKEKHHTMLPLIFYASAFYVNVER
jgi:hypothetical protein